MNFLSKIQQLPERKRKIILWSVTIISALFLLGLCLLNIQRIIKGVERGKIKEKFQTEKLEENLKKIEWPEIKLPELNQLPEINENQ